MGKFVDKLGREWSVEITVAEVDRVREFVGVNLYDVFGDTLMAQITRDPSLLCRILYSILKPTIETRSLTPEQFAGGLAGDALEAAYQAFHEGVRDFTFGPARIAIDRLTERAKNLAVRMAAAAAAIPTDPSIPLPNWNPPSGAAPESAASIPAGTSSGSS